MKTGRICASISGESSAEVIEKIRKAGSKVDLIEIRLDHLRSNELPQLIAHLRAEAPGRKVIATFRAAEQGGRGPSSAAERKELWNSAADVFWAVDLEEDVFDADVGDVHRILSFHDLDTRGGDALERFERLRSHRPDVIKYAYFAEDVTDSIPAWTVLKRAEEIGQSTVAIAMGEAGKISRILGPAYGSQWTYASLGDATAPGQLSINELVDTYRLESVSRTTSLYGVIGDPVTHSLSPQIHNAAFAKLGIDAVFLPILVRDLGRFIDMMVRENTRAIDLNFRGFAVTMPHKLDIMKYLDGIDDTAASIGAVNTVRVDGGSLYGSNTDADGFIGPLLSRLGDITNRKTVIYGAGGAARACVFALRKAGASVTILARDESKASAIAEQFNSDFDIIGNEDLSEADIIVNATPIGMDDEDEPPDGLGGLRPGSIVYDLVTSAEPTPFLRAAQNAGAEFIGGVEMLVAQAARQFEIWTGQNAPIDVMKKAATDRIKIDEC